MIAEFRIEGNDKSNKQAYVQKQLDRFYRRKITSRSLELSREECDNKYGVGEFFNLNVHSRFSILNGVDEPHNIFCELNKLGGSGLAVTDTGYLSSIPDCLISAKNFNMKYIVGMCAYFSDWESSRRRIVESGNIKDHPILINNCKVYRTPYIIIIAKNMDGYKELLNLNTESWENGYYYVPKVTREMLKKYSNGNLIILSGSLLDQFISMGYIMSNDLTEYDALSAYEYIDWFIKNFEEDFYVEIVMRCYDDIWGSDLDKLVTIQNLISKYYVENGRKPSVVVTNDVRYINRDDFLLHKAMIAIGNNTVLKKVRNVSSELYLKTRSELRATFKECLYERALEYKNFEIACDNSLKIADKCSNFSPDLSPKLPEIENADEILKDMVMQSLADKGLDKDDTKYEVDGILVTHKEQAEIELNRIIEKKFSSYFLIMHDIIKYSHDSGYQTGPARGSSAGSLVCFLLGITSINPLYFMLSFSRFLSSARGGYMLKVTMD